MRIERLPILAVLAVFTGCSCGCSHHSRTQPPEQSPRFVTDHELRLISIARSAAAAQGWSSPDWIYQVHRDGDGWVVEFDQAPGYSGVGDPNVTVDAGFFVKLGADEQVREILRFDRRIEITTRPSGTQPSTR